MTNKGNADAEADAITNAIAKLRASDGDLAEESRQRKGDGGVGGPSSKIATNPRAIVPASERGTSSSPPPFRFVPLRMGGNGGTHVPTAASSSLLDEVGGVDALSDMTNRFYSLAFKDATLDKFIRSRDDPHGRRFATWIHQKLGGPGDLWDQDRASRSTEPVRVAGGHQVVVHDRSSAHVAAWYSPKRPSREVGRHFKLDECRVWMRLHFRAMREAGILEKSPSFADYYVRFIGHFVRVYERTAQAFAREAFRWSADPENIALYERGGRKMTDILGLSLGEAMLQITEEEANDTEWPYIKEEPHMEK